MKSINEVYPDFVKEYSEGYSYGPSDYDPLLESFGYEILFKVDDADYQGDSRVLYKDGDKYGLLIFGWGSCSGCDSLQACNSPAEIEVLQKELHQSIKWFDNKDDVINYFKNHDWEGDYSWHSEETKRFVNEALQLLGGKQC